MSSYIARCEAKVYLWCFVWSSGSLNSSEHQTPLEGILKHRLLGPTPEAFGLVGLRKGLRICICNKFPFDAQGPHLITVGLENFDYQKKKR